MWQHWKFLSICTILSIYFYVFMEWLFFVTKPSFMSALNFFDTLLILVVSPLPAAVTGLTAIFLCWIVASLWRNSTYQRAWVAIGRLTPACILATSMFVIMDTLSYTILDFGIKSTQGFWRYGYAILLLVLFAITYWILYGLGKRPLSPSLYRKLVFSALTLPAISVLGAVCAFSSLGSVSIDESGDIASLKKRPNILLIASDGLNAEHMGVYGYERNTTPFISTFCKGKALFCENAFTNGGNSGSSITSMLTGKLPTQTKLYYPPDILRGADAYQHLPAILRKYGYRNVDISIRHYADAFDLNMRNSFDEANFRKIRDQQGPDFLKALLGRETGYFLNLMWERIMNRILHALAQKEMANPFDEVMGKNKETSAEWQRVKTSQRINAFLSFIDTSPAPFFAHIHLQVTHGPWFLPRHRKFSAGKKQTRKWMTDFYDDSILDFDLYFKEIIQELGDRGRLQNTIFVIHTDHGMSWQTNGRLPLIFIFPDGSYAGRIAANAQNLDISSTLLDYIGIPRPQWMGGHSLISGEPDRFRPIISASTLKAVPIEGEGWWVADKTHACPPFYHLGKISMIICNKCFELFLNPHKLVVTDIKGHTAPCRKAEIPDQDKALQQILDHLAQSGYDTSSIKK